MMMRQLVFLLLLFITAAIADNDFSKGQNYPLEGQIYYLEDPKGELQWDQAFSKKFALYPRESVNFGFTSSVYWYKIDLERDLLHPSWEWWLNVSYPLLEKIDIYLVSTEGDMIAHERMGSNVKDRLYVLRNFITEIPPLQAQKSILMLRVETQSSMQVPISISTTSQVLCDTEESSLMVGLYYGIFIIILLYNGILYLYTKDPNYLRYMLFLSSYIGWQLSFDGVGREYVWKGVDWMNGHTSAAMISFAAFCALYFSRHFLSTSKNTRLLDKLILVLMGISGTFTVLAFFVPYGRIIVYNTALVTVVPFILLITGIAVMRGGYRPARFYVAGWSSFLVATIIFAFNKFDLIPSFYGVNHVQQIGSAVEMIFLSWALADRVHLLQREYIEKLNLLNETLTQSVQKAVENARSKDRLFVQQSRLAAMGEMVEQIAHQWRQPLNNLALINQDMYVKFKLKMFDENGFEKIHDQIDEHLQYLSKTIDDFRNYYKKDKTKQPEEISALIDETLRLSEVFLKYAKIKTTVHINTNVKLNIARNEMIQVLMNLIKNGHDAIVEQKIQNGELIIDVMENNGIVISIEDNAGGIAPNVMDKIFDIYFTTKDPDKGTGLGLHMSKYIVEESFGGKIWVENGLKGARFVIVLPTYLNS